MTEWNGVADVTVAAVIIIPVEESRKLWARAIYLRQPRCIIWKRLGLC